jgi:hypothetical protein
LDEWLTGVVETINAMPMHETVRDLLWVVPTFQTIHILCVGVVFTASLIITLRALGIAGMHWGLARWQQRFAGWTAVCLVGLLLSGGVLTLAEPERELTNRLFQLKMPLVVAATLLSFGLGRQLAFVTGQRPVVFGVKLGAIVVLLLWAVIMGLGRWIAYAG